MTSRVPPPVPQDASPLPPPRRSRLARFIARLYPAEFREEFGDEIAQFVDDRRAEPRFREGARGAIALAAHLTADTLHSAIRSEDRMETLLQDLRFTVRTLVKRPAFAILAILTLTLGIGANTAIFSVVSAVILRPLPYPAADRIVSIWGASKAQPRLLMSIPDVQDLRARNHTFDDIGISRSQSVNLTGIDAPDRVGGDFVTASTLEIMGARTIKGRLFRPEETERGTAQAVSVISYGAWQSRFGGDPNIIGRVLTLNGRPHEVIGVTTQDFQDPFSLPGGVWLPITSAPSMSWFDRGNANVWAVGRVKAGVGVDDARKDVAAIARALAAELPATNAAFEVRLVPLREFIVGPMQPVLLTVLAFVAVVLLIACANVANLQLARAASRARELSVRAALGAARSRLVRQLLTESLVLALVGGAAGVVGAHWAIKALVAAVPGGLPVYGDVGLDRGVLLFSLAITLGAGLLFGAVPALHAARANLHDALTTRSGGGAIGGRLDVRNAFVGVQLALCIVLLVGASLLTRSLASLQRVDPGFDTRNLLTAEFRLPAAKYGDSAQVHDFMARAVAEIRAVPGVRSAALVGSIPLSGNWGQAAYVPVGQPDPAPGTAPVVITNYVTDGYFRTMGIPLVEGREFDDHDRAGADPVVIVNDELAKRAWPGESAIGKRLKILAQPDVIATVVGVARSVKHIRLTDPPGAQLYTPVAQMTGIFASIVARTDGEPTSLARAVRGAVWKVDADQPVWRLRSMESIYAQTVATPRFTMLLTSAFALLALLLAAVGVYGVMTFAVAQRTREVGIRMALGAQRGEVVRLVLARGARVVGVATVVGLAAAFGAAQLIRGQLFGVGTADPLTYLAVPAVLAAVALVACWLPARRAAGVDPLIALRSE